MSSLFCQWPRKRTVRQTFVVGLGPLLVQLLIPSTVLAIDLAIRSYVDRSTVRVGEQFTLSVELSGADSDKVDTPQPPKLQSFARYVGSGTSTSVNFVNGRISTRKTMNFYYQASGEGKTQIPPIVISFEGTDHRSEPISIEIVQRRGTTSSDSRPTGSNRLNQKGITSQDLFVKVSASKTKVFQSEAVILTYKIYTRVDVSRYGMAKTPDRSGFWVEDLLGEKKQLQTTTDIVAGKRYTVSTIERLALFPTSPGKKTIKPLELECEVRLRPSRRGLLDSFFSDPFGRSIRYVIKSEPVEIEVLSLPEIGKPTNFTGAVGQFDLRGSIDTTEVATNDVVTLTLELEAMGNLRTSPSPNVKFPEGLEAYDPEITERIGPINNYVGGNRKYEYVLVPRTAGTHRIEPVEFAYFDPDIQQYKVTRVNEIVIDAMQGSALLVQSELAIGTKKDIRLLAQEIRFIKLRPGDFRVTDVSAHRSIGFWMILVLPLSAIGIAFGIRKQSDRLRGDQAYARNRHASKLARNRLSKARGLLKRNQQKEFYAECGKALCGLAADKLNIPEAGMISEELRNLLTRAEVRNELIQEYVGCITVSDMRHFAPVNSNYQEMTEFLARVDEAITQLNKELSK